MTETLIIAGLLVLAVGSVIVVDALRRPPDERDPERTRRAVRTRADFEAEVAIAVSDVDEEAAAPLLAYVEEIGTGEFPAHAFDADPLGAPIPDGHRFALPADWHDTTADWLACFAWPPTTAPTTPLSSVLVPDVPEPAPFALEGPTGVFSKDWMDEVMAAAEAKAASR